MKSSKLIIRIGSIFFLAFVLFLIFTPFYLKKSLIYWYPDLDDYKIFANDEVLTDTPEPWQLAENYNQQKLPPKAIAYLEAHKTTSSQDNSLFDNSK